MPSAISNTRRVPADPYPVIPAGAKRRAGTHPVVRLRRKPDPLAIRWTLDSRVRGNDGPGVPGPIPLRGQARQRAPVKQSPQTAYGRLCRPNSCGQGSLVCSSPSAPQTPGSRILFNAFCIASRTRSYSSRLPRSSVSAGTASLAAGWRLVVGGEHDAASPDGLRQFRLQHMLAATAVVAAALGLAGLGLRFSPAIEGTRIVAPFHVSLAFVLLGSLLAARGCGCVLLRPRRMQPPATPSGSSPFADSSDPG